MRSFIAKHHLNIETTYCTINKKRHLYLKVGLWCSIKHHPRTPGCIWKEREKVGCYDVPKLCISSVAMKLANKGNKHMIHVIIPDESIQLETESTSDESTNNLSCEDKGSKSCDQ